MLKTNIFRILKTGLIIDVTNKDDVLVWVEKVRLWDHSHRPAPDLRDAVELDCEDLVREKITKMTKATEMSGEMRYAITQSGALVEGRNLYVYSPSKKAWSRPSFALAEILDATLISNEKAAELIKAGTTRDPYQQPAEGKGA